MALGRIAALLTTAALAGCLDATGERTRRDLEEIGRADLGEVQARIDQGVALLVDASQLLVRFRCNAPQTELTFDNAAASDLRVRVELVNVFEGSVVSVAASFPGPNSVSFDVDVPAHGSTQVSVRLPSAEASAPFRFAWVGDVQGGNERFTRVRSRINSDPSLEFTVFAGDVTERGRQEEIDSFVVAANGLEQPWYSVLGNHETISGEPIPFQRTVGRINVRFDYRGARFLLVDSASATLDAWTYRFLESALEPGGPEARIVGMHLPPFDPEGLRDGGFSDRSEGARVLAMLAEGGVDLLLAGHLHTMRPTSQGGVQTWVSGNGGVEFGAAFDGTDMHYLAVRVDPSAGIVDVEVVPVE